MSTGILGGRRQGFDPRLGKRTVLRRRNPIVTTFRVAVTGAALALGFAVAAAGPAYAAQTIISTKSISAPYGFQGICDRYAWACSRSSAARINDTRSQLAVADRVNRSINRRVRSVSDQDQYKQREYWALPTAIGGDCEDFALLKKRELIRAGLAPNKLAIATVLDRQERAHAVLVLRTDSGDYVLDNLTSRIKPWNKTGYSFLRMQDAGTASGWTLVMKGGIFG